MKLVNPKALPSDVTHEIEALALRQSRAGGLLFQVINRMGGQVETGLKALPGPVKRRVEEAARTALLRSYHLADRSRDHWAFRRALSSDRGNKVAATLSGAIGGLGGLPATLAELPVTTTVIFRAVQGVAEAHGEDPRSAETRLECLRVFGSGGPGADDDGIDTALLSARMALTGPAVHGLVARIAPRFATVLGQKLAAQAVPVLGAAAGAGTNYAFVDYYVEVAHIHFALRRLARDHGEAQVVDHFHAALAATNPPVLRA